MRSATTRGVRLVGAALVAALGVVLGIAVSGRAESPVVNVFAGNWTTNTGSVSFEVTDATTGAAELSADGGHPCSSPTVYYIGTYSDPGPRTGVVAGCTVGSATHLVARYVGDHATDPGASGDIDIDFIAPSAFNGTYTSDSTGGVTMTYAGSFAGHFAGDGCCPAPPSTTPIDTTTTPPGTSTTAPPQPAAGDVFNLNVAPIFPIPGLAFNDELADFQSNFGGGGYSATIDWGDGSPLADGTVGAPLKLGGVFDRDVTAMHTYAMTGTYTVTVTVTDPSGGGERATNTATVTACFCVTRPPVLARTADVGPVSGQVFVKLPRGYSTRAATVVKGNGFVPLTTAREIPIGSEVDVRRGQIVVMAATATTGVLGGGEFSGGIFTLLQNRRELGLAELRLRSATGAVSVCKGAGKARTAAARRPLPASVLGLLHASVHGQFRARGRYSSATVRGTEWTTTDRCDGTLTQVTRGAVTVFDFRARRNVVVSAGHSYLARK